MRLIVLTFLVLLSPLPAFSATSAKIKKVLIQFLDEKGRHTTAPSLYERDAYQAELRAHPEKRHGIRAAVQWRGPAQRSLQVRLQMRGTRNDKETFADLTQTVTSHSGWARWDYIVLKGEEYQKLGEMIAWRVTVWEGDIQLAEQKSFLW